MSKIHSIGKPKMISQYRKILNNLNWNKEDAMEVLPSEMFSDYLMKCGKKDGRIVVLTSDVGVSTRVRKFKEADSKRFLDLGISENTMVAAAAGIASTGLIPVIGCFGAFVAIRSAEFIRTDLCYQNRNVKILGTHSGTSYGIGGPSHHTISDLSILRAFPNLTIFSPSDGFELLHCACIALEIEGPVYIRIGRGKQTPIHSTLDIPFAIGKGITLIKGNDITVLSTGRTTLEAVKASKLAAQNGISVNVVSMPTIKPIDYDFINEIARNFEKIITVEDHNVIGGLGAAIAEIIAESDTNCILRRKGIPDTFSVAGPPDEILAHYKLNAEGILHSVVSLCGSQIRSSAS